MAERGPFGTSAIRAAVRGARSPKITSRVTGRISEIREAYDEPGKHTIEVRTGPKPSLTGPAVAAEHHHVTVSAEESKRFTVGEAVTIETTLSKARG